MILLTQEFCDNSVRVHSGVLLVWCLQEMEHHSSNDDVNNIDQGKHGECSWFHLNDIVLEKKKLSNEHWGIKLCRVKTLFSWIVGLILIPPPTTTGKNVVYIYLFHAKTKLSSQRSRYSYQRTLSFWLYLLCLTVLCTVLASLPVSFHP